MLDFLAACIQLDPYAIIKAGGYLGITAIVFAESGLLIGIFLPGDSLLFVAGLLAAAGFLQIGPLILLIVAAPIVGDSVAYWFGANVGVRLFDRKDSRFFKKAYLRRTELFYEKYGARAVILARFIPIVRTLAPILAGIGGMPYRRFLSFNIVGGVAWGFGVTALGYSLGSVFPEIEAYVLPISLLIILVSFLPIFTNILRGRRAV